MFSEKIWSSTHEHPQGILLTMTHILKHRLCMDWYRYSCDDLRMPVWILQKEGNKFDVVGKGNTQFYLLPGPFLQFNKH